MSNQWTMERFFFNTEPTGRELAELTKKHSLEDYFVEIEKQLSPPSAYSVVKPGGNYHWVVTYRRNVK